ncbi:MAG: thermonuclease family protein [Gammaproteobacteria bacterium]
MAVSQVYDGDTIELRDGRKVRLIGIDTPEIGHGNSSSQPLARTATDTLRKLLASSQGLRLRFDAEPKDKYRRLLAHLYLQNGTSVAAALLEQGLATALVIPPNVWNLDCYQAAERRAQATRRGIWSLPGYQPVDAAALPAKASGFRLVQGQVVRVGKSRKSIWLNLAGDVALRIDRKDLPYFKGLDLERLENHRVRARGWLHPQKRGLMMRIRHPAALERLN